MKDYLGIIQDIKDNITENGKGEITGRDLREILLEAIGNVSVDMGELDRRIEAILGGENYDDIINSWAELEQFLSGLDESANLAELLSYKADKSDVYSRSDINTKLEDYTKTDDLGALALKDEVEMSDIKNLEDALDKKLDKEGGEIENNLLVKGELKMGVLFVPTSDGEPSSYRLAIGELGEGADIPSSGEGGLGSVTIMLGDVPYYSDSNGIVRLPAYPTGGGGSGEYLPISGGTISNSNWGSQLTINGDGTDAGLKFTNSGNFRGLLYTNIDGRLGWYDMSGADHAILHSGNIGSQSVDYARYAGFTPKLLASDIRDTNPTPNDVTDYGVSAWFSNVWNPEPSSYWYSGITIKGWSDGYEVWQLASSSDGSNVNTGLFFRNGIDNSWNNWRRLLFNNDDNARFLNSVVVDGKYNTALTLQTNVASRANYLCGLAFNGLGAYSSTYENHTHAWIGLGPVVNTAAAEIYPLVFAVNGDTTAGTNPTERMRIMPNGNVVIGTTVDNGNKFQIHDTSSHNNAILISTTNGDGEASILYQALNSGSYWAAGIACGLANQNVWSIYSSNAGKWIFAANTSGVDVNGNISASGYQLPTSAPSNPVSGGYYLYVGTLGSGAVIS